MRYRRVFVPGGSYFFTVNLGDRRSGLLTEHVDLLRAAVRRVRQDHPFQIDAMVVLPDHVHALWTMPEDDADYSRRWRLIKSSFSRGIPWTECIDASRIQKGERGIWQRRFWEHCIRDETDFARHVDYIHINPVKHGYVARAVEWPYSSIHRFIRQGVIGADWGYREAVDMVAFGERCWE